MAATAYLGLGANLGERAATLRHALRDLLEMGESELLAASSLYETEPQGPVLRQPPFLNGAVALRTLLSPHELLELLLDVEALHGRERLVPQGPRSLDLDLLLYDDLVLREPDLVIPHPRLHERRFVLVPLLEIAPDLVLPGRGERLDLLLQRAPAGAVRRAEGLDLGVWT